ncbi:hypothetical protein V8687_09555 [Shewanella baltica]|uniref:hypothetical protein n=1 Tax=Shewanella baltica TaxID=62322 RepID=UPI0030CA607A
MVAGIQIYEVTNEESFLDLAKRVLLQNETFPEKLSFNGWPNIEINVKGNRYNNSLPSSLMEGFLSLQDELYRAFCIIKYNTPSTIYMTRAEKDALELVFCITEGSTDANAPADNFINSLLDTAGNVMSTMDSRHKMAVLVAVVLAAGGAYAFKTHTDVELEKIRVNKDIKIAEHKIESDKLHANTIDKAIDALREKVRVAANQEAGEQGAEIAKRVNEGYKAVVRSAQDAETITVKSTVLDQESIKAIAKQPKPERNRSNITQEYFIEGAKRNKGYISFNVTDVKTGQHFTMKVDSHQHNTEEINVLFEALKTAKAVQVKVDAHYLNGKIEGARFISLVRNQVAQL